MSRYLILIYGIVSYAIGLCGLVFFILFMGGWEFLPLHIDSSAPGPVDVAWLVNACLMLVFGIQHSVMARRVFKETWTKVIPPASERSTYVLCSGALMFVICCCWHSVEGTLWHIDHEWARVALLVIQSSGWVLSVVATFLINHIELMGLQQVYFNFIGKPEPALTFTEHSLYRFMRHPIQFGLLVGIWTAPTMTMTHLMLSVSMTVYVFIGLYFEERDLVAELGHEYEDYRSRVRLLLPIPKQQSRPT